MLVDVHAHYYPEEYIVQLAREPDFELRRDEVGNRVFWYQGARVFTVPEPNRDSLLRIEEMDAAGIDTQVLSLGTPNVYVSNHRTSRSLAILTNDILADLTRSQPKRFRALASLPLGAVDDSLRELDRAVSTLGMDGVQLGTNYRGEYLDSQRLAPLLAELDRLGLTVLLHPVPRLAVGRAADYGLCLMLDYPFDTTLAVARLILSGTLDRFVRINWILSHSGGTLPFLQGRMDSVYRSCPESRIPKYPPSTYLDRLFFDTVFSEHPPALRCLLDTVGPQRIVLGTDSPHNPAGASLGYLKRGAGLSEADRRRVLGENAVELFPTLRECTASR